MLCGSIQGGSLKYVGTQCVASTETKDNCCKFGVKALLKQEAHLSAVVEIGVLDWSVVQRTAYVRVRI